MIICATILLFTAKKKSKYSNAFQFQSISENEGLNVVFRLRNFKAYLCQILTFSISDYIYMLICAINTIFLSFLSYRYCFERHNTRCIGERGLLVKIEQRLSTEGSSAGTGTGGRNETENHGPLIGKAHRSRRMQVMAS